MQLPHRRRLRTLSAYLSLLILLVVTISIFRRLDINAQKMLSQSLKYTGMLLSTALSIYSLRRETTVKSSDPRKPNVFTKAGKNYLVALVLSSLLAVGSAVWENYVDDHLKDKATAEGDTKLEEKFRKQIIEISPKFEEQKEELATAADRLNKQIDGASKSVKNLNESVTRSSSDMAALVLSSGNEMGFSNLAFGGFMVYVTFDSFVPYPIKDPIYQHTENLMLKYKNKECSGPGGLSALTSSQKCSETMKLFEHWSTSNRMLSYLDPTNHLGMEITLNFSAFEINGLVGGYLDPRCDLPEKLGSQRCFEFELVKGMASGSTLEYATALVPDWEHFNLGLYFEGEESFSEAFPEGTVYGHDMLLRSVGISVCDKQHADDSALARLHIRRFPAELKMTVTVIGSDKETSQQRALGYRIRKYYEADHPDDRGCMFFAYSHLANLGFSLGGSHKSDAFH